MQIELQDVLGIIDEIVRINSDLIDEYGERTEWRAKVDILGALKDTLEEKYAAAQPPAPTDKGFVYDAERETWIPYSVWAKEHGNETSRLT